MSLTDMRSQATFPDRSAGIAGQRKWITRVRAALPFWQTVDRSYPLAYCQSTKGQRPPDSVVLLVRQHEGCTRFFNQANPPAGQSADLLFTKRSRLYFRAQPQAKRQRLCRALWDFVV